MKLFSAWPRWARLAGASAAMLAGLALGTFAHYRGSAPPLQGKTALAQQFEAAPRHWLEHPRDASALEQALAAGAVAAVGTDGERALVTLRSGERFAVELWPGPDGGLSRLREASRQQGFALTRIAIDARSPLRRLEASARAVAEQAALLLLLGGGALIALHLLRQQRGRPQPVERPVARFDDVIGAGDAKAALQQVSAFLREPDRYLALGARPPRGVLLEGPPGTGKTLLARALAGECGAAFIAVDGAHFSSMFYGQGVSRVRELFAAARKAAPCIVFIDEFDGIGRRATGARVAGGASEENRIINKLLVELDGFSAADGVVVVGATNHVGNVDDALRRPGRFDLVARVALPPLADRRALFGRCLARVKSDPALDCDALARASVGLSHADVTNVVNRAAVLAAEAGRSAVTPADVQRALEAHQLGGDVSSLKAALGAADRERIAVHEGGHALVAHRLGAGKVERISIEPRGAALGVTFVTRANEVPLYGEAELRARLAMLLAGREAELMIYRNTTSGAADDLKRASELAIEMVSSMGFSAEFGLLSVPGVPAALVGPQLQERVLAEARRMLEAAQRACRETLDSHRPVLDALVAALLRDETVSGALLDELMPLHAEEAANDAVVRRVAMQPASV